MDEKFQQAVALIKSGQAPQAKQLLMAIVKEEPNNEQAWLWMSATLADPAQRRRCLEQVLRINPNNTQALSGIARLETQPVSSQPARAQAAPVEPAVIETTPSETDPLAEAKPEEDTQPVRIHDSEVSQPAGATPTPLPEPPSAAGQAPAAFIPTVPEAGQAPAAQPSRVRRMPPPPVRPGVAAGTPAGKPAVKKPVNESETGKFIREIEALRPRDNAPRVWVAPESSNNRLVALTADSLLLANPPAERLPELQDQLRQGQMPEGIEAATLIPASSILKVEAPYQPHALLITYDQDGQKRMVRIHPPERRDRSEMLATLQRRLGSRFERKIGKTPVGAGVIVSSVLAVLTIILTLLCYVGGTALAEGSGSSVFARIPVFASLGASLGPVQVGLLGLLIVLLLGVWVVRGLTQRTLVLELTPLGH